MTAFRRSAAALAFAGAAFVAAPARAQEGPNPEEVKQKVIEIEHLMKGAEESLARSTDTRSAAEKSAEAARKILDDKAKQATGGSCEQLRKDAEGGSKDAKELLERLTSEAKDEADKAAKLMSEDAGKGIREILVKIKGEGDGASKGIKWLLEKTVREGRNQPPQSGGGSPEEKKPDEKKPDPKEQKEKPEDKPKDTSKKPESKTEPPHTDKFEKWIAELPAQVRKAYETQDWDSIPPKWRDMLRDWTKRMADDAEKGRR